MEADLIRRTMADFLRIMNKLSRLEQQPLDFGTGEKLSPSEIHALDEIGSGRSSTVTALGERFGITKGGVSQLISKLHQKGYLLKTRNPEFSKEILLSLTSRGKTAFAAHELLHKRMDHLMIRHLEEIDETQIQGFKEILKQIDALVDAYEEIGK